MAPGAARNSGHLKMCQADGVTCHAAAPRPTAPQMPRLEPCPGGRPHLAPYAHVGPTRLDFAVECIDEGLLH